jgi:hypothetical protein
MKSFRVLLPLVLIALSGSGFSQSDAQKSPSPSDAQKSFDQLKMLAGDWEGRATTDPPMAEMGNASVHITMRVTSRGNALVHEMQESGTPLDATKYDHPVTMFYVDNDQVNLVHYCDAGNRPHMVARKSNDGKTIEFDFVDLSGGTEYGHMQHTVFTFIDADHHSEDWTYMMPGDKPMHAHMDLQRK